MPREQIEKPYNGGQWSESRFFSFIRSALRKASVRWGPKNACLRASRAAYKGAQKNRKWKYKCSGCGKWFKGTEVKVHHIVECGTLKCFADLPLFVERMFCEVNGFRVVCSACHDKEHKKEKV